MSPRFNCGLLLLTISIFVNQLVLEITSRFMIVSQPIYFEYEHAILQLGYIIGVLVLLLPIGRPLLLVLTMIVYYITIFAASYCESSIWLFILVLGMTRMCYAIWMNSITFWLVEMFKQKYATVLQLFYFSTFLGTLVGNDMFSDDDAPTFAKLEPLFYKVGLLHGAVSMFPLICYFKYQSAEESKSEAEANPPLVEPNNLNQPNSQPKNQKFKIAIFIFFVFAFMPAHYISAPKEIKGIVSNGTIALSRIIGLLVTALLALFMKPDLILIFNFSLLFWSLIVLAFSGTHFYNLTFIGSSLCASTLDASWPAVLAFVHHHFALTNRMIALFSLINVIILPLFVQLISLNIQNSNGFHVSSIAKAIGWLFQSLGFFVIVQVLLRRKRTHQPLRVGSQMQ